MPYHKMRDILEEERLADKKFGSTRRGIAPVYADKYMKKTIRMGDLLDKESLRTRVEDLVEWENLTVSGGYEHEPISADNMMKWLENYGMPFVPYIKDTTEFLDEAVKSGENLMFEAQLGALRDIDFGIYPYTSSSSTIAAYAPIGAGIPFYKTDEVIGIMKAYSSCVGEGPFTCEMFGAEGRCAPGSRWLSMVRLQAGPRTSRRIRCGCFALRNAMMQGATAIALTKLDVLSYMEKIPCMHQHYEVDGKAHGIQLPYGSCAYRSAKPALRVCCRDGTADISVCRQFDELPGSAACDYVEMIEKAVGCPIKYVSVGAGRDEYIER